MGMVLTLNYIYKTSQTMSLSLSHDLKLQWHIRIGE